MTTRTWTFICGPTLMCAAARLLVAGGILHPSLLSWLLVAIAILWSPLPIAIPAIIAENDKVQRGTRVTPMVWRQLNKMDIVAHSAGLTLAAVTILNM